jgi:hypothetical protein
MSASARRVALSSIGILLASRVLAHILVTKSTTHDAFRMRTESVTKCQKAYTWAALQKLGWVRDSVADSGLLHDRGAGYGEIISKCPFMPCVTVELSRTAIVLVNRGVCHTYAIRVRNYAGNRQYRDHAGHMNPSASNLDHLFPNSTEP